MAKHGQGDGDDAANQHAIGEYRHHPPGKIDRHHQKQQNGDHRDAYLSQDGSPDAGPKC